MRHFHSYGPVDCEDHFCVKRQKLTNQGVEQLIGKPEKGGHYFTLWGPRQTGKTWLLRQIRAEISKQYPDYTVYSFSLGTLRGMSYILSENSGKILPEELGDVLERELPENPVVKDWKTFQSLFSKEQGLWKKPLILLIDEVDTTPPALLDLLIGRFREMYLDREQHWLHGLALIGIRAVLGMDSQRGSPFNIQRSLHVPNLSFDEVKTLYQQYQDESTQTIEPAVVESIYDSTKGQPGLVSWFGELLTEKYNQDVDQPLDMKAWKTVLSLARSREPNNTLLNIIAKAKEPSYQMFLSTLFTTSNVPFFFNNSQHNYLYLHGIIEPTLETTPDDEQQDVCRFTSPFVQRCLYDALSQDMIGLDIPILALSPLDDLADVFENTVLNLPALLERYKDYLGRLKAKGLNPWKEQPRRKTDFKLAEAVGHFHLYTWLQSAVGRRCVVSPEFPTGNGKVDLHFRCGNKRGIIEVKSFTTIYQAREDRHQAAEYATNLGFDNVTMAIFIPVEEETVLEKLSEIEMIDGVQVTVVAIGWV
ncbi:hypothetical protein [Candidatus Parabeggiatoa sp. HSG14]|uniref:hypothetical protein n=1 Tax=Candidatus Parabeggiatoa sp. HSG14 TaxID=3055593 RepID=UPI0025A87868|nr:AAA-like domain-containing protein [Thiotrichales bacterium HSG14]